MFTLLRSPINSRLSSSPSTHQAFSVSLRSGGSLVKGILKRGALFIFCSSLLLGIPARATAPATTTALTITAGGAAVTTVAAATVVTLTATVTTGSSAITAGQVNFCDATAVHCADAHLLGVAQLTSKGSAIFRFRPKAGSNSFKAEFAGTATAAASASTIATLAVTGSTGTTTTIAQTGTPGSYSLTATVGAGGTTPPTGTVEFLDTSSSNVDLASSPLTSGSTGLSFIDTYYALPSATPFQTAAADFNGDGILDLAMLQEDATVTILLGNADGSFTAAATTLQSQDNNSLAITAGDFNRDGIPDLAIENELNGTITVLLGNGDGTFTSTTAIPTAATQLNCCNSAIAAADLNDDGLLDLVTAQGVVLLGNGDGTFVASPMLQPGRSTSLAIGDLNQDGIPDLAFSSGAVFLGNGDGTFRAGTSLPVNGPIVAGDFNGDGKLDLAIASSGSNQITVLLGKGDGTFTAQGTGPATNNIPTALALGDFNADGIADLAVTAFVPLGEVPGGTPETALTTVLLGDGTGNFASSTTAFNATFMDGGANPPSALSVGDFNGDGISDLAEAFWSGYSTGTGLEVLFAQRSTASATVTNVAVPPATGTHQVVASYTGDSSNAASTSSTTLLNSVQGASAISLSASANPASYGTPITLTATVSGSGNSPTGTVTYFNGNTQLGTGTLNNGGVASYQATALIVGSYSITASYGGDTNYTASTAVAVPLTVNKGVPTASLTTPASAVAVNTSVSFTLKLTSGGVTPTGTVNFLDGTAALGTVSLSNGTAIYSTSTLALGSHVITASYSGDGNYSSVTSTAVTVLVASSVVPTITSTTPSPIPAGSSGTATVTLSSGGVYSGTMNLACSLTSSPSGAQSLPTCSLNPTSLTLALGANGTSVLTVNTTAATTSAATLPALWKAGSGGAILAGLLMLGLPFRRRRSFHLLVVLAICLCGVASGCGGGSKKTTPGTTSGSYIFTVTGTDTANQTVAAKTQITITVQ